MQLREVILQQSEILRSHAPNRRVKSSDSVPASFVADGQTEELPDLRLVTEPSPKQVV